MSVLFGKPLQCYPAVYHVCANQWSVWDLAVGYPVVLFSKSLVCYLQSDPLMYSLQVRPGVHKFMELLSELFRFCDLSRWYLPVPWGSSFGPLARKLGHCLPCSAMYFPWQCLCPHACIKWREKKERKKSNSGSLHTLDTSLIGKEGSSPSVLSLWTVTCWGIKQWRKGRRNTGDFPHSLLSTRPHSHSVSQNGGLSWSALFPCQYLIPCFGLPWVHTGGQYGGISTSGLLYQSICYYFSASSNNCSMHSI